MKKGRFINWQKTRVVNTGKNCGESSPYWDFLQKHNSDSGNFEQNTSSYELREPVRANPDVLPVNDDVAEPITRAAMLETIRDVKLSKKERLTLQAFMQPDATEESVANKLGVTRRAVRIFLHRAQKKCEKLFVAKMRRLGV